MIEDAHKGKRQFLSGTCFVLFFHSVAKRNFWNNFYFPFSGYCRNFVPVTLMSLIMCNTGKLHNLARAVADEETETRGEGPYTDRKVLLNFDKDGVLGLGLRAIKQTPSSAAGENNMQPVGYDIKDTGKRLFGPISAKPTTFLSQFILHIAAIGDIVDGTDTTHDFNFFSLVYEWPKDVRFLFSLG